MSGEFQDHQIRDKIGINYKYTMGGQSKFFIELMNQYQRKLKSEFH